MALTKIVINFHDTNWDPTGATTYPREISILNPNGSARCCMQYHGGGGSMEIWLQQIGGIEALQQQLVDMALVLVNGVIYKPSGATGFNYGDPSVIPNASFRIESMKPNGHYHNDGRIATFTHPTNGFVGANDVAFFSRTVFLLLTGQIGGLSETFAVDNVWGMGGSNGGNFAQRYMMDSPGDWRAACFTASSPTLEFRLLADPGPQNILYCHGSLDPLLDYNGGLLEGSHTRPVTHAFSFWKRRAGLPYRTPWTRESRYPDIITTDGARGRRLDWTGTPSGKLISEIIVEGGGHTAPGKVMPDQNPNDARPGNTCLDFKILVEFDKFMDDVLGLPAPPAPTVALDAFPTTVTSGGSTQLSWTTTGATSCSASGDWTGSKAIAGVEVLTGITANKHYVLTAVGTGGSANDSADVTVVAPVPTVSLTANPTVVDEGDDSTLTWSSTNGVTAVASGDWSGSKALSGSEVVSGLLTNKHYVLSVTGTGGTTDDDADVTVIPAPEDATVRGESSIWLTVVEPSDGDVNDTPATPSGRQMAWAESPAVISYIIDQCVNADIDLIQLTVHDSNGVAWPSPVAWPRATETPGPASGDPADPVDYFLDAAQAAGIDVLANFLTCKDDLMNGTGGNPDYLTGGAAAGFLNLTITACRDKIVARHAEFLTRYGAHPALRGLIFDYIRVGAPLSGAAKTAALANVADIVTRTKTLCDAASVELWIWGANTQGFYDQGQAGAGWLNAGTIAGFMTGLYGLQGDSAHGYEDVLWSLGYSGPNPIPSDLAVISAAKRPSFMPSISGSREDPPVTGQLTAFMTEAEFRRAFFEAQVFNPAHGNGIFSFGRTSVSELAVLPGLTSALAPPPIELTMETPLGSPPVPDNKLVYYRSSAVQRRVDWNGALRDTLPAGYLDSMHGLRWVQNRLNPVVMPDSENFSAWTLTTATMTANAPWWRITPTGGINSLAQRSNSVIDGQENPFPGPGSYRYRVRVRPTIAGQVIRLRLGNSADGFGNQDVVLATAGATYEVASPVRTRSAGNALTSIIYPDRTTGTAALDVTCFGIYHVGAEVPADMIPEYVRKVDNDPDYFTDAGLVLKTTKNGNSIGAGVISDAVGGPIEADAAHVGFGTLVAAGSFCALAAHGFANTEGVFTYDLHPLFADTTDKGAVVTLVWSGSEDDDYFFVEMAQLTGVLTAKARLAGAPEVSVSLPDLAFAIGDRMQLELTRSTGAVGITWRNLTAATQVGGVPAASLVLP